MQVNRAEIAHIKEDIDMDSNMKIAKVKSIKLSSTDGVYAKKLGGLRLPKKEYYEAKDLATSLLMMRVR